MLSLALLPACGSETPVRPNPVSGPLLPLKTGNSWVYKVTDSSGLVTRKTTTVGERQMVGGGGPNQATEAFLMVTQKANGQDETHSWQDLLGDKIVRYRELSFGMVTGLQNGEEHWMPYKLRVDGSPERTKLGVEFVEEYQETKVGSLEPTQTLHDSWRVARVDETIRVGDETFSAIKLERTGRGSTKAYWFVPGLGKVREIGGQTEELESYSFTP